MTVFNLVPLRPRSGRDIVNLKDFLRQCFGFAFDWTKSSRFDAASVLTKRRTPILHH